MGLTRVALIRPLAITMLFMALAAMGIVAYTKLPVERFPPISFPSVNVSVSYPGAAPEDVETLVTKPIENAVVSVNGINTIESTSSEGSSRVQLMFVEGTDVNQAAIDTQNLLSRIQKSLPSTATAPAISKANINAFPIMNIAVSSSKLQPVELAQAVNDTIQPAI